MPNKHTPAPWRVILAPTQIVTGNKVVANINKACIDFDESQANARLIASAPELLEALELAGGFPWVHNAAITNDIEALRAICLSYSTWWNNKAMPAIAKAKGG